MSCKSKDSPFVGKPDFREVVSDESATLIDVSSSGITTLKMKSLYGGECTQNFLWENTGIPIDGDGHGKSIPIVLRGYAQIGDQVKLVRRVATFTLKTGQVFDVVLTAYAERLVKK